MKLIIGKTYLRQEAERTFLCASVTIEGETREAFFSVEQAYSGYLTPERSDAFVVGFLTTAMRMGWDMECHTPITKRLHYQITNYLIPAMADNMEIYRRISICAPVSDEKLPCEKAVGTGWTGGVDSMYTLMNHLHLENPGHRLTHLVVANNGALESGENQRLLAYMVEKARKGVAAELGLQVIGIDSNLQLLQKENYLAVAAFRLPAVILAVQKLFGVFLNSAGYEFDKFSFVQENSAYYELLPLQCFETDCTSFYSANGAIPRIQKLQELSDFPLAHKYLHPCIYAMREDNCGNCGKCVRTQAALYALGTLEKFHAVFPVEHFMENKTQYLAQIVLKKDSQHYGEVLTQMHKSGIPITQEIRNRARILRSVQRVAAKGNQADNKKDNME